MSSIETMTLDHGRFLRRYGYTSNDIEEAGLQWHTLEEIYEIHRDSLAKLKRPLQILELTLRDTEPPPHAVRGRIKEPEHVIAKIIRKAAKGDKTYTNINASNYAEVMTDLIGARVLHLRKQDWFPIDRFIRDRWNVYLRKDSPPIAYARDGDPDPILQDYKRWGLDLEYRPRGYRSVHYVIELLPPHGGWAEVQVRTLIEEAWSEIDHALSYPRETDSHAAAQFLLTFNRIAGAADEMGSFVTRHWNLLDIDSKGSRRAAGAFDPADIAGLARILSCSTATVMAALEPSPTAPIGTDPAYRAWRKTRDMSEDNTSAAGGFGDTLAKYYVGANGRVRQYRVRCGSDCIATPMYTTEARVGMRLPKQAIKITLDPRVLPWKRDKANRALGLRVLHYMAEKGVQFWNDPIYRLNSATLEGDLALGLSIDEYFSYRFTSGLLEDELLDAALNQSQAFLHSAGQPSALTFPLRQKLLAKGTLGDFGGRVCAVGVTALCAFAAGLEGFRIPLHTRSAQVADGRGLFSVVPKALHQPGVGSHELEQMPYWTLLREIFEEIFSGSAAERNPEIRDAQWFLSKCKPVKLIHEGAHDSAVWATGFAIDSLKGSCHVSHLVAVADKEYLERYIKPSPMWEQKGEFEWVSSRDSARIAELVTKRPWASDGLFSFIEGLFALKKQFPDMVELPENLDRYLASPA